MEWLIHLIDACTSKHVEASMSQHKTHAESECAVVPFEVEYALGRAPTPTGAVAVANERNDATM